jgi:hypothetical protein
MFHICGVSKPFGEWYQKTNKTEDTNKLTLLAFKIIVILHNTRLATFIKPLETVSKGRAAAIQERVTAVLRSVPKDGYSSPVMTPYIARVRSSDPVSSLSSATHNNFILVPCFLETAERVCCILIQL